MQRNMSAWDAWREPPLTAANDNEVLPRVVALTGLAGSGKSTVADYLVERRGYVRVKFAGPLKDMMRAIGLSESQIEGDLKETPCRLLQGKTPRFAMQTVGCEWGRDIIGPEFWVFLWERRALQILGQGNHVVCDDCRFDNEAAAVRDMGGVVVRLEGRGGIAGTHASEAGVKPDAVLNNDGTLDELRLGAEAVLRGVAAHP